MSFPVDTLSQPGAQMLADRIKNYWMERGRAVPKVTTEEVKGALIGQSIFCVRSNMVRGTPPVETR